MSKLNVQGFVSGPPSPGAGPVPVGRPAKDPRVESLRGLAILLMVAGHVIGSTSQAGMRVDDRSAYRYFYETFTCLRLPLFSVISGLVYSLTPVATGALPAFVRRKSARLLLPFLCVMPLQYLMRMAVPGVNFRPTLSGLPEAFLRGFDQFWFLQAIFLIFLLASVLDALGVLRRFPGWLLTFLASLVVVRYGTAWAPPEFSAPQATLLLPFFLLGCGILRFPARLFHPAILAASAVGLALGVSAQQGAWFGELSSDSLARSMVPTLVGLTGNLLMVRWFPTVRSLAFYGSYAYTIFLLHVFFTAGSRMAVHRAGLGHPPLVFAVSLLAGINLPILAERWLNRRPILRRLLLGIPGAAGRPGRPPELLPPEFSDGTAAALLAVRAVRPALGAVEDPVVATRDAGWPPSSGSRAGAPEDRAGVGPAAAPPE